MATLEALVLQLRVEGASEAVSAVRSVDAALNTVGRSANTASAAVNKHGASLFEVAFAAQAVASNLGAMAAIAGRFSGVSQAAQYQRVQIGLEALTGSADKAAKLLGEIKAVGASSDFDTAGVAKLAQQMLAAGFAADTLGKKMRVITDTTSVLGGNQQTMERIALALRQVRQSPRLQGDELNQLLDAGVPLQRIASAASGRQMTAPQARAYFQSMTGEKAAETILLGMERAFSGKAAKSFLGTVQNIFDTAANVMEPTGKIILGALQPIAGMVSAGLSAAQRLNEMSGGVLGLTFLIRGAVAVFPLFLGGLAMARNRFVELTASLYASAAAARTASVANGVNAATGVGSAISGAGAAGIGGVAGLLSRNGLKGLAGRAVGAFKGLSPAAKGFGIGFAADMAGQFLGDRVGGDAGAALKSIGSGAGIGAGIGSIVPGIGTGVGLAIGAGVGAIKSFFDKGARDSQGSQDSQNLKKAAEALQEIKAEMIGGKNRANSALNSLVAERALAVALANGIG